MENLIGKSLGKYRIVEHLGSGGMAEVYKAHQPNLDRQVAIKLMHSFLAEDAEFRGRFEREARSIATLRHPNIVQVHDFDAEGKTFYMVMEFIDGPTLKSRIEAMGGRGERLPISEMVRIIQDLGSALAYAHKRGMIHRDVKPANVMLDSTGRVTLTDFGIAKILSGPQYTASGTMVGTPAYMAPEVGLGQPGDARSDLYSLGVMLYWLLAGKLPYDADTPIALVLKHVNEPLPLPRSINPEIPEGLERIILKALAKNPDDRFQTVDEFLLSLSDLESAARMQYPTGMTIVGATARMRTLPHGAATADVTSPSPALVAPTTVAARPRRMPWTAIGIGAGVIVVLGVVGVAAAAGALSGLAGLFAAPSATPTAVETPIPSATPVLSPTPDLIATNNAIIQLTNDALSTLVAPTATPNLTATAAACTYGYRLESTDPADGAIIFVNQTFTLTVNLLNSGECAWPQETQFVLTQGDRLDASTIVPVSSVQPGQPGQIEIPMQSPRSAGKATQTWELRRTDGRALGDPITLNFRFDVPRTATPRATATPTATATPLFTPTPEVTFVTDLFPVYQSCDYAGDDYVCATRLIINGGQPPYTIYVEGTRYYIPAGEPANFLLRSRRCYAFPWSARVTDDFGSNVSRSFYFDPGANSALFPGGACT